MTEEGELKINVIKWLKIKRIYHLRLNSGTVFTGGRRIVLCPDGTPDILCIHKGKPIGIELKTTKGVQSPAQKKVQEEMTQAGGHYYLVRSLNELEVIFS